MSSVIEIRLRHARLEAKPAGTVAGGLATPQARRIIVTDCEPYWWEEWPMRESGLDALRPQQKGACPTLFLIQDG